MPLPVANKLKRKVRPIAHVHEKVCVLFADICSFTPLSNRLGAMGTVEMLDSLVSQFDKTFERHGITLIKTVGDCVFACSGVLVDGQVIDPIPAERAQRRNPVRDMCLAAIDMIEVAKSMSLKIRIGINYGPCVSGVIGTKKPAFDLWGSTINVSSRMESTSLEMRIQLSRAAYEQVDDCFDDCFEFDAREVEAKGVGKVSAYMIQTAAVRGGGAEVSVKQQQQQPSRSGDGVGLETDH